MKMLVKFEETEETTSSDVEEAVADVLEWVLNEYRPDSIVEQYLSY